MKTMKGFGVLVLIAGLGLVAIRPYGLIKKGQSESWINWRRSRTLLPGGFFLRSAPLLISLAVIMAGILRLQAVDVLIAPVAATAQSYYSAVGDVRAPYMTIDGSGMTPNTPVTAASTAGNVAIKTYTMWLSANTRQTWITFDLGSIQAVTGFHLWNNNENGVVEIKRGVKTAGIYTGTNLLATGSDYASGGTAWGTLVTNMTFAQGSGSLADAGSDYTFDAPVSTRYLQLYVTDNFAGTDTYTGIAEIRFYAAPQYTITGSSSGSAYAVSGTDLLQTHLSSTVDALILCDFGVSYPNSGSAALTDGVYGTAGIDNTCQINGGSVTYFLNTGEHPAGYAITNINTYCGWKDNGRRNQNYTVSFRKAGSDTFGNAIAVAYAGVGTDTQTYVNIAGLGLTGVDAVRFAFPGQQNNGVGYKEFDVFGSAPAYTEVTRLDSGTKVIANDEASNVLITEGTGVPGDITLGAAATAVRSLTQSTTAGIATVNPAGQALALNGIYLQTDAGGLTVAAGTLTKAAGTELFVDNRSTNGVTVNAVIADGMGSVTPLTKAGIGTLTLNGVNTYSGVTVFEGGVVDVATLSDYGSAGSLGKRVRVDGWGNVGLLFRGGTLRYAGATPQCTDRAIRINADNGGGNPGGATLNASGSVPAATLNFTAASSSDFFEYPGNRSLTLTGSNTGDNLFAMAIRESGGATRVTKSGIGTWVLAGANAYSGATLIEGGTLKGRCPMFAPIAATAQSYYAGDNRSPITAINGTGMTPNNPVMAYSTAGNAPANRMWLSDKTKQTWITFDLGSVRTVTGFHLWNYNEWGTGTVEPYRGVRTAGIYAGTNLLADGSSYTSAGAAWGTLVTNMTFAQGSGLPAYAGSDYTFAAPVTTRYLQLYVTDNFPGADAYTGIAEIRFYDFPSAFLPGNTAVNLTASGTALILGINAQTIGSLAGAAGSSVVNDGTLTAGGDNSSQTFAGVISGAGSYIKTGSGRQTLSGTNTYGGATTVSAGTLEITEANALPASTTVEIAAGAGMVLNNAGEQPVAALTFDGVPQYRGTWGGPLSGAQHKNPLFAGTGVLHVLGGPSMPGTIIIIQ